MVSASTTTTDMLHSGVGRATTFHPQTLCRASASHHPLYVEWERTIQALRESHPLFGWLLIIDNQIVVEIRRSQMLDTMYAFFRRDIHHPLKGRAQRARLERLGKVFIDAGKQ